VRRVGGPLRSVPVGMRASDPQVSGPIPTNGTIRAHIEVSRGRPLRYENVTAGRAQTLDAGVLLAFTM
jgi:hypothetical protein